MRYLIFNPKIFKQVIESITSNQLSEAQNTVSFQMYFLYVAAELLKVGTADLVKGIYKSTGSTDGNCTCSVVLQYH